MDAIDELKQDIKSGTFAPVYLLFGSEGYLVRSYARQLKNAIIGDDTMNDACFQGSEVSYDTVSDLAQTMPFFAERRLIRIDDSGIFKKSDENWVSLIEQIPEGCHILFTESAVDKRTKTYKAVMKTGRLCDMERQSETDLKRWVLSYLGKDGYRMTKDALDLFLTRTGDDMENIMTEMDKLRAYAGENKDLTVDTVTCMTTPLLENRIFDMVSAVSQGRTGEALSLYYDLLSLKEKGSRILFLIARQMNQLLCTREMIAGGARKDEISARLKLPSFVAGKMMTQARTFTVEQLEGAVALAVELEEAFKSGRMNEQIAVETLLCAIASRRSKGFTRPAR